MKKIFILLVTVIVITACNNNKKTQEVKSNTEVGVPNVNGNIPDTTNAVDLDMHKKVTKSKDSLK